MIAPNRSPKGGAPRVGAVERIRRCYAKGPSNHRACMTLSWADVCELRLLLATHVPRSPETAGMIAGPARLGG